ncbi:MAG: guanylate kinase [Deltaproteobacteria bacterium]|nr:guanylate kinase [Deltaproteobacteria bacterium]
MSDEADQPFTFSRRGILFILSAPSGAGKTTLSRQILDLAPDLRLSISYTTRAPRPGEVEGRDYHFISEDHFVRLRAAGAFAEWARVHDFFYGTARAPLDEALAQGQDFLLDIDVQGARQLKASYAEAVSIFVLPPSWHALADRLRGRGTDREEVIARRLQRAREETSEVGRYDYWLVNDRVDHAVALLQAIMAAERARVSRLTRVCPPLALCPPPPAPGRNGV